MSRTIVFALDGSIHSANALRWGLSHLNIQDDDTVFLVTVGTIQESLPEIVEASISRIHDSVKVAQEEALAVLDDVKSFAEPLIPKGAQCHYRALLSDDARDAIISFCEEVQSDLLVLGTRGAGWLKKLWMGSTCDYCIRYAPCSVLAYRDKESKTEVSE